MPSGAYVGPPLSIFGSLTATNPPPPAADDIDDMLERIDRSLPVRTGAGDDGDVLPIRRPDGLAISQAGAASWAGFFGASTLSA